MGEQVKNILFVINVANLRLQCVIVIIERAGACCGIYVKNIKEENINP